MRRIAPMLMALMSTLAVAQANFECPDLAVNTKNINLNDTTVIAPDILHMHSGINYLNDKKLWAINIGPINGNWPESLKEAKKIINNINSPGEVKYSQDLRRYYCAYSTSIESIFITLTTYEIDEISDAWSGTPKARNH